MTTATDGDDESLVVSGFVASPLGARYADGEEDTLETVDGLALAPLSVHVERVYAEDGRGVSSPQDDGAYVESILRTSTGTFVVNYVIDGERTSVDFEMGELDPYDSLFWVWLRTTIMPTGFRCTGIWAATTIRHHATMWQRPASTRSSAAPA